MRIDSRPLFVPSEPEARRPMRHTYQRNSKPTLAPWAQNSSSVNCGSGCPASRRAADPSQVKPTG